MASGGRVITPPPGGTGAHGGAIHQRPQPGDDRQCAVGRPCCGCWTGSARAMIPDAAAAPRHGYCIQRRYATAVHLRISPHGHHPSAPPPAGGCGGCAARLHPPRQGRRQVHHGPDLGNDVAVGDAGDRGIVHRRHRDHRAGADADHERRVARQAAGDEVGPDDRRMVHHLLRRGTGGEGHGAVRRPAGRRDGQHQAGGARTRRPRAGSPPMPTRWASSTGRTW